MLDCSSDACRNDIAVAPTKIAKTITVTRKFWRASVSTNTKPAAKQIRHGEVAL